MLSIFYKPTFVRQYKKMPDALKQEIKEKIELFREDPKHRFLKTHKLKGKLKEFWSFSVNYKYRIVFSYISKQNAVLLCVGDYRVYQ